MADSGAGEAQVFGQHVLDNRDQGQQHEGFNQLCPLCPQFQCRVLVSPDPHYAANQQVDQCGGQ